ncbi:MAG: DUF507 family protein [Deltaproteobacteria bacterium]|nr:DUF507 family protein [Deltaproteobacteria bacterium]
MAQLIARGLLGQEIVRIKADEAKIAARVSEVLEKNFAGETALEAEAERLAAAHARSMTGMDQRRIVRGIMERLARERNFPL